MTDQTPSPYLHIEFAGVDSANCQVTAFGLSPAQLAVCAAMLRVQADMALVPVLRQAQASGIVVPKLDLRGGV